MDELAGQGVLVTGASSGIGWALAEAFAHEGARVALVARRRERLERLRERIAATGAPEPVVVAADLSVRGAAAEAAATVVARLGTVDVLVNNAGGAVGGSVWAVADGGAAREDFEVDFWSPLALIGALVPAMRRRGRGAVVNVTSIRQVVAWPSFGQNGAAQAALALTTETLRLELARFGVQVVEVIPGPVETPAQGPTRLMPGIVEALHGRLGVATPEELATRVIAALRTSEDRVFCPDAAEAFYADPVAARRAIGADARRVLEGLPADDSVDTLVVGADHPLIADARAAWEREREAV